MVWVDRVVYPLYQLLHATPHPSKNQGASSLIYNINKPGRQGLYIVLNYIVACVVAEAMPFDRHYINNLSVLEPFIHDTWEDQQRISWGHYITYVL